MIPNNRHIVHRHTGSDENIEEIRSLFPSNRYLPCSRDYIPEDIEEVQVFDDIPSEYQDDYIMVNEKYYHWEDLAKGGLVICNTDEPSIYILNDGNEPTKVAGDKYDDTEVRGLISDNTAQISQNKGRIDGLQGNIEELQNQTAQNSSDISSNTERIETLATEASELSDRISANAADISGHTEQISEINEYTINGHKISGSTDSPGTTELLGDDITLSKDALNTNPAETVSTDVTQNDTVTEAIEKIETAMAIQAEAVAVSLNEIVSNTPSKLLVGNVQTPSEYAIELSETALNIIDCSRNTGITDISIALPILNDTADKTHVREYMVYFENYDHKRSITLEVDDDPNNNITIINTDVAVATDETIRDNFFVKVFRFFVKDGEELKEIIKTSNDFLVWIS